MLTVIYSTLIILLCVAVAPMCGAAPAALLGIVAVGWVVAVRVFKLEL